MIVGEAPSGELRRFDAVDGLRAWMAWAVVAAHIVNQAGLRDGGRLWAMAYNLGNWAVETFIIISGFVITHLLLQRQERYLPYLVRRFLRLFPALVACCVLGWAAYAFAAAYGAPDWFRVHHAEQVAAQHRYLPAQVALHLTMLHGAVPNSVIPLSQYAFLPPAWSVSLEWQFYLVAPLVVAGLRDRRRWLGFVLAVAAALAAYRHWLLLDFRQPSLILGSAHWFAAGIASRFAIGALAGRCRYPGSVAVAAILSGFALGYPAIGVWLACYAFLLTAPGELDPTERRLFGLGRLALEGRAIQFLAARSYSTYLLHWPVMLVLGAIGSGMGLDGLPLAAFLLLAVPLVLVGQEALYRGIERPGIAVGRRLAARLGEPPLPERRVTLAVDRAPPGPMAR